MGILLVVQGAASYPVRYHADTPPRTSHRLPSPRNTDELVQLLLLARRKFGASSSYSDAQSCEVLASEAGLL